MRVATPAELGALARDRRGELGLSQDALAAAVGVTRYWVISFERGRPGAKLELVLRALAELGLAVDVVRPSGAARVAASDTLAVDLDELIDAHRVAGEDAG